MEEDASTVDDAVNADSIVVEDAAESCIICFDRPRAVRMLPCGHAAMCELCTIRSAMGPMSHWTLQDRANMRRAKRSARRTHREEDEHTRRARG